MNPGWRKSKESKKIYSGPKGFSDKEDALFVGICGLFPERSWFCQKSDAEFVGLITQAILAI